MFLFFTFSLKFKSNQNQINQNQINQNQNQCSRLCLFGFDNLLCASLCWSN